MEIKIKRIYEKPDPGDGVRILVDRLWPRGIRKASGKVDYWARKLSPSNELRKWYGHDPEKWAEFQARYAVELDGQAEEMALLIQHVERGPVSLLYSSKEQKINNAYALKCYTEKRMSAERTSPVQPSSADGM